MPLILPARFASLADAAAAESTRYAMTGVRVSLNAKQTRLTATDSRILLDVALPLSGPEVADYGRHFPKSPALDAAPNSATCSVVDADLWRGMKGKRARRAAIVLGDAITTIGTIAKPEKVATAVDVAVAQANNIEGRFPPADDIIRQTSDPWARFSLSAGSLAKLLKAMSGVINQDTDRLDFEVREPGKPVVIKAIDPVTAAAVTGIIMPMADTCDVRSEEYNRQAMAETLVSKDKVAAAPKIPLAEHDAACKQYRDTIAELERRVNRLSIAAAQALPPAPAADQGDTVTVEREEFERMLRMARQAGYQPPAD